MKNEKRTSTKSDEVNWEFIQENRKSCLPPPPIWPNPLILLSESVPNSSRGRICWMPRASLKKTSAEWMPRPLEKQQFEQSGWICWIKSLSLGLGRPHLAEQSQSHSNLHILLQKTEVNAHIVLLILPIPTELVRFQIWFWFHPYFFAIYLALLTLVKMTFAVWHK